MNIASIYGNPRIEQPEFLFVEINGARTYSDKGQKVTILELRAEPLASGRGGDVIYSNLYHSKASEHFWELCRATFGFERFEVATTLGRWGKIYLVPSEWNDRRYSTVQYVQQTDIDLAKVARLSWLAAHDAIPWGARDATEAKQMVREALARVAGDEG